MLTAFDESLSRVRDLLSPWLANSRQASVDVGFDLWRKQYGDPDDPKVRRMIARQIETLNRMAGRG